MGADFIRYDLLVQDALRSVVAVARIKLGLYGQGAFNALNAAILAAKILDV